MSAPHLRSRFIQRPTEISAAEQLCASIQREAGESRRKLITNAFGISPPAGQRSRILYSLDNENGDLILNMHIYDPTAFLSKSHPIIYSRLEGCKGFDSRERLSLPTELAPDIMTSLEPMPLITVKIKPNAEKNGFELVNISASKVERRDLFTWGNFAGHLRAEPGAGLIKNADLLFKLVRDEAKLRIDNSHRYFGERVQHFIAYSASRLLGEACASSGVEMVLKPYNSYRLDFLQTQPDPQMMAPHTDVTTLAGFINISNIAAKMRKQPQPFSKEEVQMVQRVEDRVREAESRESGMLRRRGHGNSSEHPRVAKFEGGTRPH